MTGDLPGELDSKDEIDYYVSARGPLCAAEKEAENSNRIVVLKK